MIKISFKYYLIIQKLFAVQNLYFYPPGNLKRNFFSLNVFLIAKDWFVCW